MNYISIAGALHGLGQEPGRPQFPTNLLGDFGGGSTYLVIGVLAALLEARVSGAGQVVDAAIVDGTAHLSAMYASMLASGFAQERRAVNLLDGGAPFYDVYETADGRHMSVGALEPQFYALLLDLLGLPDAPRPQRPHPVAGAPGRLRRAVQGAHPGRVDGGLRGHRRLCRPGAAADRGGRAPAPARPRGVRRPRRRAPARTGSPVLPHGGDPATGPTVPGGQTREALEAWGVGDVDALLESGAAQQA